MPKTSNSKTSQAEKSETFADEPRQLKRPAHKSFRLQKRVKGEKVAGAFRILGSSFAVIGRNWKLFLGITLIYGFLNMVLVQGFQATGSLSEAKDLLDQLFAGSFGQLASGLTLFVYLLGSSGNTANPTASAYQLILILVMSLAIIWALRQAYAGHAIRIRDSFYRGMSPLVQFVLVLIVVCLQLIPMAVGLLVYGSVVSGGLAATGVEQVLWALFAFLLSLLSLYLLASSLFALYIVTLPDMTPVQALRSARQLVAHRRWTVMRKVLFLPLVLLVLSAVIIVPVILYATPLASWIFFVTSMLILPIVHSYMYSLYRALL